MGQYYSKIADFYGVFVVFCILSCSKLTILFPNQKVNHKKSIESAYESPVEEIPAKSEESKNEQSISIKNEQVKAKLRPPPPKFNVIFQILTDVLKIKIIEKVNPDVFCRMRCTKKDINDLIAYYRAEIKIKNPVPFLEISTKAMMAVTRIKCPENLIATDGVDSVAEFTGIQPTEIFIDFWIFGTGIKYLMKHGERRITSENWKKSVLFVQEQFGLFMNKEGVVSDRSSLSPTIKKIYFGAKECPINLVNKIAKKWNNSEKENIQEMIVSFEKASDFPEEMAQQILKGLLFKKLWSTQIHEESCFKPVKMEELMEKISTDNLLNTEIYLATSEDKKRFLLLTVTSHSIAIDTISSNSIEIERITKKIFARFTGINSMFGVINNKILKEEIAHLMIQ